MRYCARPDFALESLREVDAEHLAYESVKPGPGGGVSLMLTPLELIERLAVLIPPLRRYHHRYYGALSPNASLRAKVTALASANVATPVEPASEAAASAAPLSAMPSTSAQERKGVTRAEEMIHRRAARYAWAKATHTRPYHEFDAPPSGRELLVIVDVPMSAGTHRGEIPVTRQGPSAVRRAQIHD